MLTGGGCFAGSKGLIEQVLIHLPRSLGVGIGKGRLFRGCLHSQMTQFTYTTGKAAAYFSDTFCLSKLTEQHGNKLIPGIKSFCIPFGFMLNHQAIKLMTIKQSNQLTKQAGMSYQIVGPPLWVWFVLSKLPCPIGRTFSI